MTAKSMTKVFAHMNGFGSVNYHPQGHHIITTGSDAHIRAFNPTTLLLDHAHSVGANSAHRSALRTLSFSASGDSFVVAGDDHTAHHYAYPKHLESMFAGADSANAGIIHSVSVSNNGHSVAIASDHTAIRIVSLIDVSQHTDIRSHTAAVRFVRYNASDDHIVSVDARGTIHVHSLIPQPKLVMTLTQHGPPIDTESFQQMAHCSWSRDGLLAVSGQKDIAIYQPQQSSNEPLHVLKGHHTLPVSICAFSPNDAYLCSVDDDGNIAIWSMTSSSGDALSGFDVVAQSSGDTPLVGVCWAPNENALVMMCSTGHLRKWSSPIPTHLPAPYDEEQTETAEADADGTEAAADDEENVGEEDDSGAVDTTTLPPIGDTDEDVADAAEKGDGDGGKKLRRLKKVADALPERETSSRRRRNDRGIDDDDAGGRRSYGSDDDSDNMSDFIDDDTDGAYRDNDDDYIARKARQQAKRTAVVSSQQAAFQSSSTPFPSDGVKKRYLAYTLEVCVTLQDHGVFNSVECTFTDTSAHRAIRLRDHYGFAVCAVGEHGALMASPFERVDKPSVLFYKAFDSWTTNADWTLHLPPHESALCVAVGKKWCAVGTNKQYIRLMTYSGLQLCVFSMEGAIVTMTGRAHLCAVVYYAANGSMRTLLLDIDRQTQIVDCHVALSPSSTLTWLSFTEFGMLISMDSSGIMRGLSRGWGGRWIPILDSSYNTAKSASKNDIYWPVGVVDNKAMCAVCKITQQHPSAMYKPILTGIPLIIPFVEVHGNPDVTMSETYARNQVVMMEHAAFQEECKPMTGALTTAYPLTLKQQINQDKLLLTLANNACAADMTSRAMDLITHLSLKRSGEVAIKIANKYNKTNLASRIMVYQNQRWAEEEKTMSIHQLLREEERQKDLEKGITSKRAHVVTVIEAESLERGEAIKDAAPKESAKSKKRGKGRWDEEEQTEQEIITTTDLTGDDDAAADDDDEDGEAEMAFESRQTKRAKVDDETDGATKAPKKAKASTASGKDFLSAYRKQLETKEKEKEKSSEETEKKPKKKAKSQSKKTATASEPSEDAGKDMETDTNTGPLENMIVDDDTDTVDITGHKPVERRLSSTIVMADKPAGTKSKPASQTTEEATSQPSSTTTKRPFNPFARVDANQQSKVLL